MYHSELIVPRYSSGTVSTWPVLPKKETIFFEVIFTQTTFVGFGLGSKTHRWTVALLQAHTPRFIIRHLWRFYKRHLRRRQRIFPTFLYTKQHEPFFCAGCNENKSFYGQVFLQYWMYAGGRKCPRMSLSQGMSYEALALVVHARQQCSLTQRLFLEDLNGFRLWASYGSVSLKQFFSVLQVYDGVLASKI